MTNASLELNDIRRIGDEADEEEEEAENSRLCESPVLSKVFHRSQHSIKEMTPDDPELVEAARRALTPLPATPQALTGHTLAATVPVEQAAVNPSFSVDTNLVPPTAKIPESLCDLLNFENTSWTSSLATPHGQNVTYSNLNTEEKKVLVSRKPVPRTLFTPEVEEEQSQKSQNESLMECSETLHNVKPKKICKGHKEFAIDEIFSSNDASRNTIVLTGVEKYSDISLASDTYAKEPCLVREVLDLLVSPVTAFRQKTCSKAESLSETPSHSSTYKYAHEFGKLSQLRPKAKRLFRRGNETCSDRESDTTINGDQINSDIDGPTVDKELPISPNLSSTFNFASPISPVIQAKADEKQQKDGVMSCSPLLHRTQEFLHDFSFSTLEEVCQASEVLASGCTSPIENCEISDKLLSQKREPYRIQNVSPIEFEDIVPHSSRFVVNKTSTPIHTVKNKKVCANKKKIKFLNVHREQKCDSSVIGFKEKLDYLCKPQVTSLASSGVEQFSEYDSDLLQHSNTLINENNCGEPSNVVPDTTESLRHRVNSVKSSMKQKKKFAYFSELGTCNTVNVTKFPSVDTVLSNMLQSAEALEAMSLLKNENISTSLKKHLEHMSTKESGFVPFNEWGLAPAGEQSTAGNFVNTYNSLKNVNILEEESKINLDKALHKTLGDHTVTSGRKRKKGSHGILGDHRILKRTCIKELQDVVKRPDFNSLQPYVSDTQLNVVFDNVEVMVAEFNSKCDILGTVGGSCNTQNLSSFHKENKCLTSLLKNIRALPSENYGDKENIRTEENDLSDGKNRTEFCKMNKREINVLKTDLETGSESSRNQVNKFKKELSTSESISLDSGSTKTDSITKESEIKQKNPKVCKFSCHEGEDCGSEESVIEAHNETSFLNSHQHIFDSSFTAVTQKVTEPFGKEQTKEEALLNCEQKNSVECNVTDETKNDSSLMIGSVQNLSGNINEDNTDKDKPAGHAHYAEFDKRASSQYNINSEGSNNISENKSVHQPSHTVNKTKVLQNKCDTVISPSMCNAEADGSKIQMHGNSINENLKESCKLLAFSHDKHHEKILGSDQLLQTQHTVTVSSVGNAAGGLCVQSDITDIKVLDRTNHDIFFTTAKGKKIEMSKEGLDKAFSLFRDIVESNIGQIDGQDVRTVPQKGITETVTIREGNLTKLKVSKNNDTKNCKESYEKSDSSDMQDSKEQSMNLVNSSATVAVPLQVGFSTASGKKFTISEKSLQKARHMFQTVMELETEGVDTLLKDSDVFSIGNTDTASSSNRNHTNLQRCTVLSENAMLLSEQFQNKVLNGADTSSNDKTLQCPKTPESVRISQTMSSKFHKDVCVTADSHLKRGQKHLDETKKHFVKYKTNHSAGNVANDEQKDRNILVQEDKSRESLLEIDNPTVNKIELGVRSKTVESGFTTAAGRRVFILGKDLHKAKKIFSDIVSQHFSESKDCNTGTESSVERACDGNHECDYTMSADDQGHLSKTSSYKTVQAMVDIEGNNGLLNSECDTLCVSTELNGADLLMDSCTLPGSMLEDTKTKFESTFVTPAENDDTSSHKFIKVEASIKYPDNCHRIQTEVANSELYKDINSESNLNRGFMTAAGRNVTVSAASLDRAKSLLSDISVMNVDDCKNIVAQVKRGDLKESPTYKKKHKHSMLKKQHIKKVNTALQAEHKEEWKTGRKVSLMGRNLIESLCKLTIPETVGQTDLRAQKHPENISAASEQATQSHFSCGFQTAACKPLEISLPSINKVEEMFDDIMNPVVKGQDYTVTSQREERNEQFKKSQQNAETISLLGERNISVHNEFMKTLDTTHVAEIKLGTNFSPEKNNTFSFVTASDKDVEISQLLSQGVKRMVTAPSNFVPKEATSITTEKICSSKKIDVTASDKVKKTLLNNTVLIEQTSNTESENEIKILDNKENSARCKSLKMYSGFVTAGGKKVNLSEESLMKVRNIFSDITEDVEGTMLTVENMKEKEAVEESSSKGKDVIALEEVNNNSSQDMTIDMKKISETGSKNEVFDQKKKSLYGKKLNMCSGFVTAGGKKVDVSEESLKKVRNLFSDITESVYETTFTAGNVKRKEVLTDMCSSEGRDITSLEKDESLPPDRTVETKTISDTESENKVQFLDERKNCKRLNRNAGFTTAGGKKINVSEKSLAIVRTLFSDVTDSVENNAMTVGNMKLKEAPEVDSSKNKDILSIEKAENSSHSRNISTRKISDREFENEVKLLDKKKNSINCEKLNICGGFVTAGGKKVHVSEESLASVRNLFSDITENVEGTTLTLRNVKEKEAPEMYCVKKKSHEKVNNSSPDKNAGARKISDPEFENDVNLFNKEENSVNCNSLNMCGGFVTAGGKKVKVSEESLERVRNIFSDITENVEENTLTVENVKEKETTEWQSPKKKDILSPKILKKTVSDRNIGTKNTSDSESENEVKMFDKKQNVLDSETLKMYDGFVTGCGKKVEFSEESLAKVRSLFSDITDKEEHSSVVLRFIDSSSSCMKNSRIANTDCLQNEFVDMETHLQTKYQKSATKRSKETVMSVLDAKSYASDTPPSNKPHGNVLDQHIFQHRAKVNPASKLRKQKHETTLTQEVSESTAALLLDDDFKKELEESDSSCFSMLTERSCSPDLSLTVGSTTIIDREPGSPVIGSRNKCNRPNKVLMRKNTTAKRAESITAAVKNLCDQSGFEDTTDKTSFIPEVNCRRKRCSSVNDNQMHKKQCMSNTRLKENGDLENDREQPVAKTKTSVIPSPGSWLQLRMTGQEQCIKWRDISDGKPPCQFTESKLLQLGVKKSVINVTSKTAAFFKFSASDFYREENCRALQPEDDIPLKYDVDGFAGIQEVEQAFLTSPHVDKSLIPAGWIQNHYRWIAWKLAATERSFPHIFASRYLTPHVMLLQLKYRYDREIDRCQRPALRRIMEHDDAPGKRMVLCVADVIKHEEAEEEKGKEGNKQCLKVCNYELELTDGWYSIWCTVDMEMCHLIEAGRVAVGTKLVTHSAELVNCEQPCPPLEAGPNVRLKIHTNSTRRARWDCRLGYCRQPGPLPVSLSSLKPAGGVISCVTVVIARVYPIVYMEKGPDGKAEFYSAKQEAIRASKRERQWQEHIEKLYSQERAQLSQIEWFSAFSQQGISKGMSKKQVTTPTRQQLAGATCAEDLYQLLCNAPDPASLQSLLTDEQRDAVANYQQMRQQQLLQELEARVHKRIEEERNVTSSLALLKVRCLDARDCSARSAVLSIWRPSEDLLALFQEGSVMKLFSITANGLRNGDLQLSACRQSRYQPQSCHTPKDFPARCVTPLSQVSSGNLHAPFGELDCVGVVVHVTALSGNYQTVYLADADMDIVGISFWNGLKGSGWEDILQQKALVACSNLQSRVGAAVHWIPTTYATEFSIFSQNPRQKHLVEALESLGKNLNMDIDNFSYTCEGIVLSFLNEQIVTPVRNASLNVRQTKPSTTELSRLNIPAVTPDVSEKVQRRLFKLEQYGEPPSLSPLALIPRSRALKKNFHVPVKTDQTAESSCDDSPPMSLDSDDS